METVLIAALASACLLSAIEGLIRPIGKWRGLVALTASLIAALVLDTNLVYLPVYGLAAAFLALVFTLLVDEWSAPAPKLPPRVPPR